MMIEKHIKAKQTSATVKSSIIVYVLLVAALAIFHFSSGTNDGAVPGHINVRRTMNVSPYVPSRSNVQVAMSSYTAPQTATSAITVRSKRKHEDAVQASSSGSMLAGITTYNMRTWPANSVDLAQVQLSGAPNLTSINIEDNAVMQPIDDQTRFNRPGEPGIDVPIGSPFVLLLLMVPYVLYMFRRK